MTERNHPLKSMPRPVHTIRVALLSVLLLLGSYGLIGNDSAGFLQRRGDQIVDAALNPILMRGFNMAFKDFRGPLGEADLKRIAESGANSIRLVLNYRDLERAPFVYNDESFTLLDKIVEWSEAHGLYVILDLHLAPGIQNPHDFVVHREKTFKFWRHKKYQERFYALWEQIAKRYAPRRAVAGYDLLNEGVVADTVSYLHVMNHAAQRIRKHDGNHLLIVEEAIMPNWDKKLLRIEDPNTVYSVHFFQPPQFTFYTTTRERTVTTYPGAMRRAGALIEKRTSINLTGTRDWHQVSIRAVPPSDADILLVTLSSQGNTGMLWIDDVRLEVNGEEMALPAPLVANNSFEVDYPGISWNTTGSCAQVTDEEARTGKRSLMFSACAEESAAVSSPIATDSKETVLSAWIKTVKANGSNHLTLSWHRSRVMGVLDKGTLKEHLQYALDFKTRYNVPLYVGEFTAHANPQGESVTNYLSDLLDIMEAQRLHWSYWTYYSEYPGIGAYTGDPARLARPELMDLLAIYAAREPPRATSPRRVEPGVRGYRGSRVL